MSTTADHAAQRLCGPAMLELSYDSAARENIGRAPVTTPRTGKHIVVVDDEAMLVAIATRLLTREGYCVSGFTDASKALELIRSAPHSIDVLIIDFHMPRVSGLDFAHFARSLRQDLPIILSSGYLTTELEAAAEAAGVHVLSKMDLVTSLARDIEYIAGSVGRQS